MLISPAQIRAARAHLDWSVKELAAKTGSVKEGAIYKIEDGTNDGSIETLTAIVRTFESAGIEITEDGGIRPRQSRVRSYRGAEGFCAFFDDIYEVARTHPSPDFCVSNVREALFEKWLGSYDAIHMNRMSKLKQHKVRALLKAHDSYDSSSSYTEYRWVAEDTFADVSFYIYGDKVAFIEFLENTVVVTVVDNQAVANSHRKMFDVAWSVASTTSGNS